VSEYYRARYLMKCDSGACETLNWVCSVSVSHPLLKILLFV
jgi:hypothetical protein